MSRTAITVVDFEIPPDTAFLSEMMEKVKHHVRKNEERKKETKTTDEVSFIDVPGWDSNVLREIFDEFTSNISSAKKPSGRLGAMKMFTSTTSMMNHPHNINFISEFERKRDEKRKKKETDKQEKRELREKKKQEKDEQTKKRKRGRTEKLRMAFEYGLDMVRGQNRSGSHTIRVQSNTSIPGRD